MPRYWSRYDTYHRQKTSRGEPVGCVTCCCSGSSGCPEAVARDTSCSMTKSEGTRLVTYYLVSVSYGL